MSADEAKLARIPDCTLRQGKKLARYADWMRVAREVKRYINEGNDFYTVDVGGFSVRFEATKGSGDGK